MIKRTHLLPIALLSLTVFFSCGRAWGLSAQTPANDTDAISILPDSYAVPAKKRGTVETFTYTFNGIKKTAFVYLPYGYEQNRQRYNILYFMHGGGGSAGQFFERSYADDYLLNNILDHAIEDGTIKPLIVVTPTFYAPDDHDMSIANAAEQVKKFPAEFVGGLMPAVEQKYRTYAEKTDKASFEASRKHRAFGGFSMGSVTTWFEFAQALDYVAYFMPISGDCWQFGTQGGQRRPAETTAFLGNIARTGTHGTDFYIYAATGSDDFAYPWLSPQIAALKNEKGFTFGSNAREGNITFHVLDGGAALLRILP